MTEQEQVDFDAMKTKAEMWEAEHHKRQVGEDQALQDQADMKEAHAAAIDKLNAEHQTAFDALHKQCSDQTAAYGAEKTKMVAEHAAFVEQSQKQIDALQADHSKVVADLKATHAEAIQAAKTAHETAFNQQAKENRLALLKEKQRVDKLAFDAKQAAEAAAIQ